MTINDIIEQLRQRVDELTREDLATAEDYALLANTRLAAVRARMDELNVTIQWLEESQ